MVRSAVAACMAVPFVKHGQAFAGSAAKRNPLIWIIIEHAGLNIRRQEEYIARFSHNAELINYPTATSRCHNGRIIPR